MIFSKRQGCFAVLLPVLWIAAGCGPMAESSVDEQREAHFLNGKARAQALDFPGAIEAYEKAIEVNPRNASAHFELGYLYEEKAADHAAAIYHYNRFLKLNGDSAHAQTIQQRIMLCKQELARTVTLAPVTQSVQRDIEKLAAENLQLKKQVEQLQDTLARRATNAALAAPRLADSTSRPPAPPPVPPRNDPPPTVLNPPASPRATGVTPLDAPAPRTKTYSVQSGDTPTKIAKKFGVKLDALLAANPHLDPKRMKIGQSLTIPSP